MNPDRTDKKPLGFNALKGWLRHRHPMILLDRVLDHQPGEFLTGLVVASGGLDFMAGHFPDRSIYPGTHLLQAFSQTGILLFQLSTTPLNEAEMTVISSLEARFFKVVVPGDRIEIHTRIEQLHQEHCAFAGTALVDGIRAAAFRARLVRAQVEKFGDPLW
jgi:3-hydroxyacyl-[acyl-carrier-protein] dehydratase